jgi:glyoxylase-like metal-dependent hydrolase (beta-lactamase superfamily II)
MLLNILHREVKLSHQPGFLEKDMQQIIRGIYYEDSYLGVTLGALVFSHGTIMIDAPLRPEDARSWRSALLNQRGGTNRILICLDAHLDRTLGARALDTTIVAHQKTAQVFRNRPTIFKGQSAESGSDWEAYNDAIGTRWASPDITFTQRMSLYWGGPEVQLDSHPGPGAGAIWASIPEEKVIFVGDIVQPGQPPFLSNADLTDWIESLELLLASYKDFTIVSGRGGPVRYDEVRSQHRYLKNIAKGLERLAKRNAPPEATEDLIPALLSEVDFTPDRQEQYSQRLRSGLYQYYARHYRPSSALEHLQFDESEP